MEEEQRILYSLNSKKKSKTKRKDKSKTKSKDKLQQPQKIIPNPRKSKYNTNHINTQKKESNSNIKSRNKSRLEKGTNKLGNRSNKLGKSRKKSDKMKIKKTIVSKIEKFYNSLYNNYVLILFLESKNIKVFISNLYRLSLKLDGTRLTTEQKTRFKKLYLELNKKIIKKYNLNKKNKFKNIDSILKGGQTNGPYLQRLISKGDEPITGNDMAKTLEEIMTILSDLRYLDDAKGAYGPTVLLNYFMGNDADLRSYLRYRLLPKFIKVNQFPPQIAFGELYSRWDNIVDLLNLYKNDRKIKNEWAVSKGLKSEDVLKETFIDKLASKVDSADQKFQKLKMAKSGNLLGIV